MADVFISYAREDTAKARLLAEALIADGLSVWWDHDLIGGDNFREQIADTIERATCVIVIWSENSVKSRFVKDEANRALEKNTLLPVSIGGVAPPVGFGELQTVSFKRWAETSSEWDLLVGAVHTRVRSANASAGLSQSDLSSTQRQLLFFSRNIDIFLLTMFTHGLACFLLFQPLIFLEAVPMIAKLGVVIVISLFVSALQSWVLISQKASLTLRGISFGIGVVVGLMAYYFAGATVEQIGLLVSNVAQPGAGISLFNGFVFFIYILVWGMIGILVDR